MNRFIAICHNVDCEYQSKERSIAPVHLGQGVFQKPVVVCECDPRVELPIIFVRDEATV